MNNLQSFSNFAEHCGCDHSEDKKKKSKVTKEEIIKEYGDPTVSKRLRVARAIDSTFRGKAPKYNSKRAKISNALKMSSIKAETKKRKAKENPYSAGKKLKAVLGINSEGYIPEEGYDIARDMGMVKPSKDKKDATTMPRSNTKREKENLDNKKKGDQALDSVIAGLRKKYGKNAVMDMSKKKVKEDVDSVSIDEKKLVHGTYGNFVSGQKSDKKSDKPMTPDQRRMIPEKMDPVGQEDGDINNDGKKDGTDKYLASRRKAIGKAIAKKRGRVKEGFSAWRVDLDFQEQVKK